jgi:hypothetical protein
MTCAICTTARRFGAVVTVLVANAAILADHTLNFLLLGSPDETVSARADRARAAGSQAAARFCAVLTWIGNVVFRMHRDHCTWAAQRGSLAHEIWHWSPPPSQAAIDAAAAAIEAASIAAPPG